MRFLRLLRASCLIPLQSNFVEISTCGCPLSEDFPLSENMENICSSMTNYDFFFIPNPSSTVTILNLESLF